MTTLTIAVLLAKKTKVKAIEACGLNGLCFRMQVLGLERGNARMFAQEQL